MTLSRNLSVSRTIVPLSFLLNVACQLYYGLLATPSMKQVADAHHSTFSPNPYFITVFYVVQFISQFFFVIGLFSVTATPDEPTLSERFFRLVRLTPASPKSTHADSNQIRYSTPLALGNLLHVIWTVLWMHERFWPALSVIVINTAIQFLFGVVPLGSFDHRQDDRYDFEAHVISKLAAGVGFLGIIDTASTAVGSVGPPSTTVQIFFVYLTAKLATFPESNGFWFCSILFDLLALCFGQPAWSPSLALAAVLAFMELYMVGQPRPQRVALA